MTFADFFYENFVNSPTYTLPAVIVYGILFIAAIGVTFKIIKKLGLSVDDKFLYALTPFILLGGILRAVGDTLLATIGKTGIAFLFITPGVYLLTFTIALVSLLAAVKFKRAPYWKAMIFVGAALDVSTLVYLAGIGLSNISGMLLVPAVWALWVAALYIVSIRFPKYLTRENFVVLLGHMLDASATFVALQFHSGFMGILPLPHLISVLGLSPVAMFALKLVIVWPVLYYIDKDTKNPEYRTWLKIAVLILGLPMGIHDTLQIGLFG